MQTLKPDDLSEITPEVVRDLNRETLENLALQVVDLALHLANRLNLNSSNSSIPPSSDDPYRRQGEREKATADKERDKGDGGDDSSSGPATAAPSPSEKPPPKPPGKRPGMPGHWRSQPLVATGEVDRDPVCCASCSRPLGMPDRHRVDSAHQVYELERGDRALRVICLKHRYFAARCACGQETVTRPAEGKCSKSAGRKRNLVLTE